MLCNLHGEDGNGSSVLEGNEGNDREDSTLHKQFKWIK